MFIPTARGRGEGSQTAADRRGGMMPSNEHDGEMTDGMAAMFDRLRDAAAAHDHDHDLLPPLPGDAATSTPDS
jgi:hypothetical protein